MALKSIEAEWDGFASMVFAKMQPTDVQVAEMKKAFFAGAWSMFCAMEEIGEPHVSEAEGHTYLLERKAECVAFKKRLMADYAETN